MAAFFMVLSCWAAATGADMAEPFMLMGGPHMEPEHSDIAGREPQTEPVQADIGGGRFPC